MQYVKQRLRLRHVTNNSQRIINAFNAGGTGVCNVDKLADGIAAGGNITEVTSQEIINGDALRAKGFVVVNV